MTIIFHECFNARLPKEEEEENEAIKTYLEYLNDKSLEQATKY